MDILLLHSIYQHQFRDDLKEMLSREFNIKEEKDIESSLFSYFGFKGKVKSITTLCKKINALVENNYSFDDDEKMVVYFVDDKQKQSPRLKKKRLY